MGYPPISGTGKGGREQSGEREGGRKEERRESGIQVLSSYVFFPPLFLSYLFLFLRRREKMDQHDSQPTLPPALPPTTRLPPSPQPLACPSLG